MDRWLPWSLLALLSWGFWGLFPKLATNYVTPRTALLYEALGAVITVLVGMILLGGKPEANAKGMLFGMLAGVSAFVGAWFYLNAAARGRISSVVAVSALYPAVTVVLAAIVLREPVSLRQITGLIVAIGAIVLLST